MTSPNSTQLLDVYTKGTQAWFTDEKEGWVSASVLSKTVDATSVKIVFQSDEEPGKEHVFETSMAELEKTKGANLPPLRNPPKMENTDDLTNLSYLNEPSVLNTIRTRYHERNIYTYSGIVLIAANPFARVPLYEPEIIQQYSGRRRGELEPHLFAIAEDAYRCMIREKSNQTIVVSGESGAGKTVSAKYIMRYFATADDKEATGKNSKSGEGMTEVEEQILATNPIMEAFGNAKTTRNDNSSRFGKYIEIQFDKKYNIVGAKIRTYLLERSRLVFQPETERNYHIFYQLCAGAPAAERADLGLKEWTQFNYLNGSGTGVIPGVDDVEEFELTQKSLSLVGISVQTQWQIFRLLAALLHIGNIEIGGRGDATLADDEPSLELSTKLLGINKAEFRKWIVRKQIITRSEKIVTNLNPTQAQVVRDSVAKYIYANLFEWLVSVVNNSLSCSDAESVATFIGVLDIYGFEHFKKNSFEQFCINYANEKLQQQFNQHVFKLEQEEYVREQIDWKFISFSDNQKCIEMIEAKLGILSLLDEESRLPSGTDQGFCNKLYSNFNAPAYQDYFKKPRFSNNAFTVCHYAHDVQYEADGFLDKNKDTVPEEHLALIQNAESAFLVDMIQTATSLISASAASSPSDNQKRQSAAKKPTLGSMFKLSLINLMDTIGQTNVHYIRCIKPNEAKVAWAFEANMVLSQLRACGVLETIRISCAGYPTRWTFEEFADRYYALVNSQYWDPKNNPDIRKLCMVILDTYIKDPDKYQIGLTKLFFRAGQLAYMEKLRSDRWNECAVVVQKNVRRYIVRIRYLRIREMVTKLQQIARQKMGLRKLEKLRQERAAVVIQKYWRRYIVRKRYLRQRALIIQLQAGTRGLVARKRFARLREHNAATRIQAVIRGWTVRKRYQAQRNHMIRIQTCVRRRNARKQLMAMRAEARSVSHFKEVSYKLENKVVELAQSLKQQKDEKAKLKKKAVELEAQVRSWVEKYEKLDKKSKDIGTKISSTQDHQNGWSSIQQERDRLQSEYIASLSKIKSQDKEISCLTKELTLQKEEISKLRQASQTVVKTVQEPEMKELKKQVSALKAQLSQTFKPSRRQQSLSSSIRNSSQIRRPGEKGGVTRAAATAAYRREAASKKPNPQDGMSAEEALATAAQIDSLRVGDVKHDQNLHELLQDELLIQQEIIETLVESLAAPLPNPQEPLEHKDIVFPAHAIAQCISLMWKHGYLPQSERLLFSVLNAIDKHCSSCKADDAIIPCAFWMMNAYELRSLICSIEQGLESELQANSTEEQRAVNWRDVEKMIGTAKFEVQCLEDNIYCHLLTELKTKLSKMVIPAVIESQPLPGFMTADSGRFFKQGATAQAAVSTEDMLQFLNQVHRGIRYYEIETSVTGQVFGELFHYIGVTAFNDLLMRRNFNSWKRAMQIQCNVTRLEEWCKSRQLEEIALNLDHLNQATRLLQMKKASVADINTIFDVSYILMPIQIQRLMQNYHAADYEPPIGGDVMKAVASRVTHGETLFLDQVSLEEHFYDVPETRHELSLGNYLPASLNLQHIRRLIAMSQS
ncbi:Myosin type-2 heavy chain 1 [Apophysomyces ossiformis]|uniref:Myosin type-2 heavy chain 1 n=1 Tax=Apophysomyces ossiformis TaxID=679940 RepID=A0A8H7ESD9_9FUNG|nr:Myosin type-2 heavy chain 1 [Apophysomyces ossiformis]